MNTEKCFTENTWIFLSKSFLIDGNVLKVLLGIPVVYNSDIYVPVLKSYWDYSEIFHSGHSFKLTEFFLSLTMKHKTH